MLGTGTASAAEKEAFELLAEADKKASHTPGFFAFLGGGSNKREEAAELYIKAANQFKLSKRCTTPAFLILTWMRF